MLQNGRGMNLLWDSQGARGLLCLPQAHGEGAEGEDNP